MKSPTERRDGGDELPREARDLLRRAARPVPPTAAERAAIAAMAARIAAIPLPPSPSGAASPTSGPGTSGLWSKLVGLGAGKGVGIAGLVLAVGGGAWIGATMLSAGSSGPDATSAQQPMTAGPLESAPIEDPSGSVPVQGRVPGSSEAPANSVAADKGLAGLAGAMDPADGRGVDKGLAGATDPADGRGVDKGLAGATDPASGRKTSGTASPQGAPRGGDKAAPPPGQTSVVGRATAGEGSSAKNGSAGARSRDDGARLSANGRSPAGNAASSGGSPTKNGSSAAKSGSLVSASKATSGGAVSGGSPSPAASAPNAPVAPNEPVAPVAPVAPVTACPSGPVTAGDRVAEGPILAAAAKALSGSPLVTLACIQELARIGGPFQLKDEQTFLAFEASRRLGREADAKRFARALLRASPGSAYAAKARAYLGDAPGP